MGIGYRVQGVGCRVPAVGVLSSPGGQAGWWVVAVRSRTGGCSAVGAGWSARWVQGGCSAVQWVQCKCAGCRLQAVALSSPGVLAG